MSFLFGNSGNPNGKAAARMESKPLRAEEPQSDIDRDSSELIARRPALLDEKLKLHGRIIDEFNLALLEKLSPEELFRQVQIYVSNYVRAERISLNQKELEVFAHEALAEMIGFEM